MWVGGHYSDFKLVERLGWLCSSPEPRPLIRALERVRPKVLYINFTVLDLKSENFWENLKIHAGGDDKLRIQFAPPNVCKYKILHLGPICKQSLQKK